MRFSSHRRGIRESMTRNEIINTAKLLTSMEIFQEFLLLNSKINLFIYIPYMVGTYYSITFKYDISDIILYRKYVRLAGGIKRECSLREYSYIIRFN